MAGFYKISFHNEKDVCLSPPCWPNDETLHVFENIMKNSQACTFPHDVFLHLCSRLNANAAFLCNYEVMQILQQIKERTQRTRREATLATVAYETVHYLQQTESKYQNPDMIKNFLIAMKDFKLTKTEKLMMVNTPPRTEVEIQLIVQESEERLSEEEVKRILEIVNQYMPAVA